MACLDSRFALGNVEGENSTGRQGVGEGVEDVSTLAKLVGRRISRIGPDAES